MAEQTDFAHEADSCLHLAEAESDAAVKTILTGMGHGWLTLAAHRRASGGARPPEPIFEPTEEPSDDSA